MIDGFLTTCNSLTGFHKTFVHTLKNYQNVSLKKRAGSIVLNCCFSISERFACMLLKKIGLEFKGSFLCK